jgi:hypothetical protein
VLVNQELGKADNSVLLASLLVPVEGTTVQVLQPPLPGGGCAGLGDLIAPRVRLALWQLVIAFVLLALWRARRLGRPVVEPQPVQLPGAELVVAVGNLLQRAKGRGQAAGLLTDDLRRCLAERLGLPPSPRPTWWPIPSAARTGHPRERVLRTAHTDTPATRPSSSLSKPSTPSAGSHPGPLEPGGARPGAPAETRTSGGAGTGPGGGPGRRWPGPDEIAKAVRRPGRAGCPAGRARCCVRGHVRLEGVPGVAKTLAGSRRSPGPLDLRAQAGASSPPT